MTKSAAVKYLLDNPSTLNQAKIESKERDFATAKIKASHKEEAIDEVETDQEMIELRGMAKILKIGNYGNMSKEELQKQVDTAAQLA